MMKILTADQIKEADAYTIKNEPVSSVELMERASNAIAEWIIKNVDITSPLFFLIGKGNNGGDGLAVARILHHAGYNCSYHMPYAEEALSDDCKFNFNRLPKYIERVELTHIDRKTVVIDALLGTGVKSQVKEPLDAIIEKINCLPNMVISIDMPSGMISEFCNSEQHIIKADITISLECPKLAMLLPEAGEYCGEIVILPIGLSKDFIATICSEYYYITDDFIKTIVLKRDKFAHKGTYGHALLICGSQNMMGAAILSVGAALRSGCGLVSAHVPEKERLVVQSNYPSALLSLDKDDCFSDIPANLTKYAAVGIGCGLGLAEKTVTAIEVLLKNSDKPMVLDADALNIIANNPLLKQYIPNNSVLTPHPGELKRLVGEWEDERQKIERVRKLASELQSTVVVKGAHTMICAPDGCCYFNSTGNSGMAKGGSGDVLTGYITGLLARGYAPVAAAVLGVYVHGKAGDKAAIHLGMEAMNSKDLIDYLTIE